jgi:ABC-type Fe3+-hydroxamate transport system substrate-binding protein
LQDGVALSSTTLIPFLEMLGLRTEIKAWLGYASSYISSPCVNQMIDDGDIAVVQDTSNTAAVNALRTRIGADIVSFHNDRSAYNSRLINITVSEFFEATNEQIFEWIKFFSVFFNLEAKANVLFDIASTRYQCVGNEAADYVDTVNQGVKPTVLWATYTNYDNVDGWNVAQCPNYYCELADLCSAKIIQSRAGTIDFYGTKLFTTADFAALAKDADHWIYPAPNWGEAYGKYKSILDQFKSVKNRRVFDTTRSGPNAWFEQRLAEFGKFWCFTR